MAPLGGCSEKITREHFLSRSVLEFFSGKKFRIDGAGFLFGGKDSVEIGIDSFSAKVLCDNHNSRLSVLDNVALTFCKQLEDVPQNWPAAQLRRVRRLYLISGTDLERWLIKMYCGLVAAGVVRGLDDKKIDVAQIEPLLKCITGERKFQPPLGLHHFAYTGQNIKSGGWGFNALKLTDGSNEVGGLQVNLGIATLVLIVSEKFGPGGFYNANFHRHTNPFICVTEGASKIFYVSTYE